jgi:hypothetical protein
MRFKFLLTGDDGMNNQISVPNKDKSVRVNLTIKEILALAGDKFEYDKSTLIEARKKIRKQLLEEEQI